MVIFVSASPADVDPSVPILFSLSATLVFGDVITAAKLLAVVNLAECENFYGINDVFGSIEIIN